MRYDIRVRIAYEYGAATGGGRHLLRLLPLATADGQTVRKARLTTDPAAVERQDFSDFFGNAVTEVALPAGFRRVIFDARAEVDRPRPDPRPDLSVPREGLTRDLGFSKEDRDKNIERVTFVAKLLSRNGVGVILSFISPYREARDKARAETTNFIEVFVNAPLQTCIDRDVKGMYAKAIKGEIKQFTGISDPYEEPLNPEIVVNTAEESLDESVSHILAYLESRALITPAAQEAV